MKKNEKHNHYLRYNIGLYCDTHFSWGWCYWGDDASHFISEAANKKIIGTDIAHAVPLTLISGIGHASIGTVDLELLIILLVGSIPGVWLGAKLNAKANDEWVRLLLVIILFGIALKLLGNHINV